MEDINEEILKSIRNYQERLEKYSRNKNEDKILYVISKLDRLPIKTFHLENTGVGRSVNGLKKMGGNVAEAAKNLVAQWKDMVREEERTVEVQESVNESIANSSYSSEENGREYLQHNINEDKPSFKDDKYTSCDTDEYDENTELEISDKKENTRKNGNREEKYSANEKEEIIDKDSRKKTSDRKSSHNHDKKEKQKHRSNREQTSNVEIMEKSSRHIGIQEGSSKSTMHKSNDKDKNQYVNKETSSKEREKKSKHKKSKHMSHEYKRRHSSSESDKEDKSSKSKRAKREEKTEIRHKSSSKSKERHRVANPASSEKIVNGIDSQSGASFAEALGMCSTIVSSSSKSVTKKKSEKTSVSEKNGSSSRLTVEQEEEVVNVPTLLKQPNLEPLHLNISSLLPEITPNYRPLSLPIDSQPRKILTDDEALSRVMMNKNQRTKVYSGNKSHGKVETLFDLCVRVLQDNIDALEYTGGVPYIILKPVLEKATADQLFNMEHHNPYLVDDTDYLWKRHCDKQFRTKKREELESWRDMYMRCLDEREARLNAITANIKQSQDKSIPIRTTKLAYVDSVVKPPRNIARKQAKNGIINEKKPLTPTERLSLLSKSGEASKVAVPNPAGRAAERHSSATTVLKQKKAPLMAKTLSLFKNRFKR